MSENRRLQPTFHRSLHGVAPALRTVLRALVKGEAAWPLLLWGGPGLGKTSAALALADVVETASYHTAEGLATFVMNHCGAEVEGEFQRIAGKHLAILDELGTRRNVGDLAYSVVKRFADLREIECGRVGIYISNVPPHELAELYDDRLASRLLCGTVAQLDGSDRREAL